MCLLHEEAQAIADAAKQNEVGLFRLMLRRVKDADHVFVSRLSSLSVQCAVTPKLSSG